MEGVGGGRAGTPVSPSLWASGCGVKSATPPRKIRTVQDFSARMWKQITAASDFIVIPKRQRRRLRRGDALLFLQLLDG